MEEKHGVDIETRWIVRSTWQTNRVHQRRGTLLFFKLTSEQDDIKSNQNFTFLYIKLNI